jgi:hemerythrin-like domain-containing protein
MLLLRDFAKRYTKPENRHIDNEDEFVPTLMNSCMFLNELSSFLSTNILNFEGRPFM